MSRPISARHSGVAYILLLLTIALMGLVLAGAGEVWRTTAKRERERELLFIGMEFRKAILAYRDNSPGAAKEYPRSLAELLHDKRVPYTKRYLRKIYRDPITNGTQWGLVMAGDRIVGVYSLSEDTPLKTDNFPAGLEAFAGKASYRDWVFTGP